MLREIDRSILLNELEEDILIIQNDTVYTLDEFFEGARILIDEDPEEEWFEEDSKDDDPELPFPEVLEEKLDPEVDLDVFEEADPRPSGRRSSKDEILKAWDDGKRSVEEVVRITGKTRQTVLKYLPKGAK